MTGEKSRTDRDERPKAWAEARHLLTLARVVYPVRHTAGNGVPLGAEVDEHRFRVLQRRRQEMPLVFENRTTPSVE